MIGGDAWEVCHWGLRRSSYGATKHWCFFAEMTGGGACEVCHWDLRRSSCGATKRVRGVPT
eukprot:4885383-Pyramimonas_sp.AAC.1